MMPLFETNKILPQTGPLRDRLVAYVDDNPFSEFVWDRLTTELWERDKYQSGKRGKLVDIEGYADVDQVATRLLSQFESLPWHFHIHIPMPESLSTILAENESSFPLCPSVEIVRATPEFRASYPLASNNEELNKRIYGNAIASLFLPAPPKWSESSLYMQIQTEGYVDRFGTSNPPLAAERLMRSVLGLAEAVYLFDHSYQPVDQTVETFVHRRQDDGTWSPYGRYNLSRGFSNGLTRLVIDEMVAKLEPKVKRRTIQSRLASIGSTLRSGKDAEPTILAAQWLFDGLADNDELLSFVRAMVVMEILLGDKAISKDVGIGELISSRFAYFVGTTHEQRTQFIDDFRKIYEVRSQIVHRGKPRLSSGERVLLHKLRWMCRRLLQKEMELHSAAFPFRIDTPPSSAP
jgi:hypothetical protein